MSKVTLVVLVVLAATACGGNRPLGDNSPQGGAAGTGSAGATPTGEAGEVGTGEAGAGGTGAVVPPQPLRSGAVDAITRIAAVLWDEPPAPHDDVLEQAQQGRFETTSDLAAAVRTMLADPRAQRGVGMFYRWWLNLDAIPMAMKDMQVFPPYTPALQTAISTETEMYAVETTLTKNGSYQLLMTAPVTFANGLITNVYGYAPVASSNPDQFEAIELDPKQRAGLLTQPALQVLGSYAQRTSPADRGTYVMERFVCQQIPSPPASVPPLDLPPPPGTTVRQALETSHSSTICAPCHKLIDGAGLAFETFDAIGRYRTTDNGLPIDVSGLELYAGGAGSSPTRFSGPVELASILASSASSQKCFAKQWLAFAQGAPSDSVYALDDQDVAPIYQRFVDSGFNLRELIVAALARDAFLTPR